MKTRRAAANKAIEGGSAPQACVSGKPDSVSGNNIPREQLIAEAAYFRAEQRGFAPGNEISDWLDAEADVERMLGNQATASDGN